MAVTVKHSTPADGTFSATGAAAWDADHNFTGTIDVANGGTGAATLTSNALLKGNGTSAVSASSITDNGTIVTIAEPVRLSTPNTSAPAWTTSGINLIQSAATFTDTSSTGTVADVRVNNFAAQTVAASNTITATTLYGTYFAAPVAGTNVTATARYALGADSATINGVFQAASGYLYLSAAGAFTLTGSTGTVAHTFASATTASGQTKTISIGTNGASGSTTNITVGSATSGATSSITANGQVTLAPIGGSRAAWTTNGVGLVQSAATWTDTSSTGTVGNVRMNNFAAQTLAATNTITVTNLWGAYFAAPTAGANVTASNRYAIGAESAFISGQFATNSSADISNTTAGLATYFASGTTASGQTKTIGIGMFGASGSTTNITLGSSTSGATSSITANGQVTLAPIGGSAAAWTTSGIALKQSAATFTDTTSTGTVSQVRMNNFAAQTMAASNVITVSTLYGAYFVAPTAGTNVTANNTYALGTDSLVVAGAVNIGSSGNLILGSSTGTQSVSVGTGVTASGSTKTINIGTGGASGSTTAITLGSSTSGATQTTTINGRVTLVPIGASAAAWTTSGIALTQSNATFTDTSSTGTVAVSVLNRFNQLSMAASNPITVTHLYGTYFQNAASGTNVTATNAWAVAVENFRCLGNAQFTSGNTLTALGTISLTGETTTTTASFATGVTASGSTKTVNIGTGGASGSTTNITIGSSTSGATSTTTLNGKTTFAGTAQLQGYTVATLPAGTQGMTAFVTDALAPTWNTTLVGGGAVVCKAFFNGTNWVAG